MDKNRVCQKFKAGLMVDFFKKPATLTIQILQESHVFD